MFIGFLKSPTLIDSLLSQSYTHYLRNSFSGVGIDLKVSNILTKFEM